MILFLGTGLPQKVLGTAEEVSGGKKHTEDTVSVASSLHSSPPVSPQGSPRKGEGKQFELLLTPDSTVGHIVCFWSIVVMFRKCEEKCVSDVMLSTQ